MEEKDFWEVTKQNVILFKDGVEIASGFICFSLYENQWEEEYEDHQRQEDDSIMIYNGKEITDYDYDETSWDEERELFCSEDYDEVLDYYKDLIKDLIRDDDEETINENGPNVVYEGNHGVYYKFNKLNGKIHGLKEMFCGDALLMTNNYSNGELDGIQTTYESKAFNEYDRVNSPIKKLEKYEKGKLLNSIEFWTVEKDSQGNYYAHLIINYKKDGEEEILFGTGCIFGEDKFGPVCSFTKKTKTKRTDIFFDRNSGNIEPDYYKNQKEFECYFPNGNIMDKRSFKNGKLDGKWKRFYENGQIQVESNHKNGKYHGIVKSYYENGNLKHERNCNNDVINGIWKDFYKNGQLKLECEWINGFQEGVAYSFYENGDKMKESTISKGDYNGPQIEWWPNGRLKAERIFKNDKLISEKNYKNKDEVSKKLMGKKNEQRINEFEDTLNKIPMNKQLTENYDLDFSKQKPSVPLTLEDFSLTNKMVDRIKKYVIPELKENGINNRDEYIDYQEENNFESPGRDWADMLDVVDQIDNSDFGGDWKIKYPDKIQLPSVWYKNQLIDLNKDYNEDEDGYYINAEEEYIEFYELIYEHWLNGTFSGESSIIHHLARNWLEENNW